MLCDFYNETLEFQENLLTKYLTKAGHEVVVVTSTFDNVFDYYEARHDKSAPRREYEDNGSRIIKLPFRFNFLNRIRPFVSIKPIINEFQPDLIYAHDIVPNMLECRSYMDANPNVRMIMDYHADYSNSGKNWLSLKVLHTIVRGKLILNRVRPYLSKIFPIVPAGFTFLNEVYGIDYADMELLPLGADIDVSEQIRNGTARSEIREELKIEKEDFVIFTGGKLSPRKQTELLIKAVNKINTRNLHLIVVGDASELNVDYLKMLKTVANNSANIHFMGWQTSERIYRYLAAADIAVFPASQSVLWQKSIAMHLPLVVGNTGNQSVEYLNKRGNIIMLKANAISEKNIRITIENLINDERLRTSMSKAAEITKGEMLNWNSLIIKLLRFNFK